MVNVLKRFLVVLAVTVIPVSFAASAAEVAHIHLAAPEPETAARWYQRNFGGRLSRFAEERQPNGPIDRVDFGNVELIFAEREPTSGSESSALSGLGFSVRNPDELAERLVADGASLIRRSQGVVGGSTRVIDPWGTRIALVKNQHTWPLHHLELASLDPAKTLDWYRALLGGRIMRDAQGRTRLLLDNGLWLHCKKHPSPRPSKGRSLDHLGIEVSDIDLTMKMLVDSGAQPTMSPRNYRHIRIAFLTGPDSARIELVQK